MKKARTRRSKPLQARAASSPIALRWAVLIPAATAVLLNLPRVTLGYFWDDFLFLTGRGHGGPTVFLSPEAHAVFYRPISQGLYFTFLKAADPASGLLGHTVNLLALVVAVTLLILLVSDLTGRRAGLRSARRASGRGATRCPPAAPPPSAPGPAPPPPGPAARQRAG